MKFKRGDIVRILVSEELSLPVFGRINAFVSEEEAREAEGRDPDKYDGEERTIEVYYDKEYFNLFYPDEIEKVNLREFKKMQKDIRQHFNGQFVSEINPEYQQILNFIV
jgi:hypothetical protein